MDKKVVETPDIKYKWSWPAHASVSEVIFNALPEDIKTNLDAEKMKDGSNDPDEKFKDTVNHHYPQSYKKAVKWLEEGKNSYNKKEYGYASYCFGVATHYISDTFSAPHCVSHEKSNDHHDYEVEANELTPTAKYIPGDLDSLMQKGFNQGKIDWKNFLKTKNQSEAAQKGVNMGASVAYSAVKDIMQI